MRGRQEALRLNFTAGDGMVRGYFPQGGLGSFLKSVGKKALGAATSSLGQQALNFIPGGTAAVSAFNLYKSVKTGGKQGGPAANLRSLVPALGGPGAGISAALGAGIQAIGVRDPTYPSLPGGGGSAGPGGEAIPRGYHWSRRLGRAVKNRHMNPLNPRALRRGMSRVKSFARFARKTISFTARHKLKKKGKR
jgi:hypothetical protein